jgi:hypothetical protein
VKGVGGRVRKKYTGDTQMMLARPSRRDEATGTVASDYMDVCSSLVLKSDASGSYLTLPTLSYPQMGQTSSSS